MRFVLDISFWTRSSTSSSIDKPSTSDSDTSAVGASLVFSSEAKNGRPFIPRHVVLSTQVVPRVEMEEEALGADGAKALVHDEPAMRATAAVERTFIVDI